MSRIKLMDEILANKIAAGEVVERCASVVKELVENSIDASSTEIKIELIDSGVKSIKVIDNGIGMDRDDAVLAFQRHATSKILCEDDLYHINTLGFRGEALASIASVSKVTLKTCSNDIGTEVIINGGKVIDVKNSDARRGTEISVEDLFYNTPARLKHLKSLYTELASITDYVNKIALSHCNIKFILINNNNVILNTSGSGDFLKTIRDVYGIEVAKKMMNVKISDSDYDISGYISLPEVHRSNRNGMVTIVNGRVVRNMDVNRVINDAYHSYKPDNRYPIIALNIDVDPYLVDVNVHPTKMDIKFSKQAELLDLLTKMIKSKLKEGMFIPHIEVEKTEYELKIEQKEQAISENTKNYIETPLFLERASEEKENYETIDNTENKEYIVEINDYEKQIDSPLFEIEKREVIQKNKMPELYPVGLVHGTYIICQNESGMTIIDQHAAKERVNYEKFKREFGNPKMLKETLLVPFVLELTNRDFIILKEHYDLLEKIGIEVEEFGMNSIIVKTHPAWLRDGFEKEDVYRIIEIIVALEKDFNIEKFRESIATMMSCKHAIKANMNISMKEMEELINELRECENPYNCPHGRPTMISYTNYDLEKLFKRSGF